MGEIDYRPMLATAVKNPSVECIYRPDAVERAVSYFDSFYERGMSAGKVLDILAEGLKQQIVYSPSEGIDRRAEHG